MSSCTKQGYIGNLQHRELVKDIKRHVFLMIVVSPMPNISISKRIMRRSKIPDCLDGTYITFIVSVVVKRMCMIDRKESM